MDLSVGLASGIDLHLEAAGNQLQITKGRPELEHCRHVFANQTRINIDSGNHTLCQCVLLVHICRGPCYVCTNSFTSEHHGHHGTMRQVQVEDGRSTDLTPDVEQHRDRRHGGIQRRGVLLSGSGRRRVGQFAEERYVSEKKYCTVSPLRVVARRRLASRLSAC